MLLKGLPSTDFTRSPSDSVELFSIHTQLEIDYLLSSYLSLPNDLNDLMPQEEAFLMLTCFIKKHLFQIFYVVLYFIELYVVLIFLLITIALSSPSEISQIIHN